MNQDKTLFDQKATGWAKHKKGEWAKKLGGPIIWVGQTLNWVGQCPAGPPVAQLLLQWLNFKNTDCYMKANKVMKLGTE